MDSNIIENRIELSTLYDFYGELLKEKPKHIFEDYIQNDLSLSEIAINAGISRQGVHDIIKRSSRQLMDYEEKLGLVDKFKSTKAKINEIIQISNQIEKTKEISGIDEIKELSDSILNEL